MGKNGGARPGSGRPLGMPNRSKREALEKAKSEGILPLDYMLKVMRDDSAPEPRRDAMASAAAPYLHSKLTAVAHSGGVTVRLSHEDAIRELAGNT